MKRFSSLITLLALVALACNFSAQGTATPSAETQPAEAVTQPNVQNEAGNLPPQNGQITVEQIQTSYAIAPADSLAGSPPGKPPTSP